ncbi:Mus7/MMS22 family-domain-containing protein [Exophiala viscosa]|uniref:Mus7/MMS22 family-domain-containing protein n=1 Tax=Exophiala viscosa TaxID=2486360 RepID=A0AAN6DWS8_9EURO|nr:Mus7/MMS22 family-domain-containing protein [Exophiala viscosa]
MMAQSFEAIASSIRSHGEDRLYPADGNAAVSERAQVSVDSLIACLNDGVSFKTDLELDDFVAYGLDQIDRLLEELERPCDHTSTAAGVTVTLPILNRLTVFGYQLSRLTTTSGKILETRCVGSRQRLAILAFSKAFRVQFLKSLNAYVADLSQNGSASDAAFTKPFETEIETVFLLHRVGLSQVCISEISDIVSNHLTGGPLQLDAAEKLASTILTLACVFSVVGKADPETYGDENADSLISSGFSVLSSAINAFFNVFLQERSISNKQLGMLDDFGRRALQWCLWLARSVNRGIADNLLRQIFKYYSTKTVNMLDLFGKTSPATPSFLELQLPAENIVPEPDDTDFQLFLKMVAFTLGQHAVTDAYDPATLRKQGLRKVSLVFSLLPNNGPNVDVEKSIHLADLAAMENRYLLLLTLYHYSPIGYKPDLTYMRNLVEFGKAHYAVCNLVIKCWASIVRSVVPQPMSTMELHQLAVWIQDMIFQICGKLKDAFVDETTAADSLTHENNRKNANALLCSLAERYAEAIDLSLQESQARQLLTGERLDELLALCNPQPWLEDSTTSSILNVVTSYLRKCREPNPLLLDIRQQLRRVLATQLGRDPALDEYLLTSMVETWFQVARTMVLSGNDSWDLYMSQHGTYSFSRIAGNELGRRCHILLLSKIAAADKVYFKEELYLFLEAWLSSMLVPLKDLTFEHILTNTLIQTAPQVLALEALRGRFASGTPNFLLTREDLVHYRLQIVRHVIRTIQDMQYAVDEPLEQGLNKSAAEGLLGVIATALKRTWQQTPTGERAAWTSFMHDVVFEISACTFPNFVIDSWFVDTNETGFQDKILHLERLFILRGEQPAHLDDEHAVQVLRVACEIACAAGDQTKLVHQVAKIFAAADFNYINEEGKYLLDISTQFLFLKAVLPAYIAGTFDEPGLSDRIAPTLLFASPVIAVATTIMSSLELRVDLEDEFHMEQFAETMVMWLVAAGKRLRSTVCDFVNYNTLGLQLEMLAGLVTLCAKACSRWAYLYQLFPNSDRIARLQEYVQTYGMYVYEYACSATGLQCSPSDPEFWETHPDSRVRSAKDFGFYLDEPDSEDDEEVVRLCEYAAKDLERAGKDWIYVRETTQGPVWRFNRGGRGEPSDAVVPDYLSREDGMVQVKCAVEELVNALVLLGVK